MSHLSYLTLLYTNFFILCFFRVTLVFSCFIFSFHRFANASKTIHCTPCGNTGASQAGATLCGLCNVGQYMLNQVCTTCPDGWTSVYGEEKCDECTKGKFVEGQVCASCGPGTYGKSNLTAQDRSSAGVACAACPQGTYSSAKGVVNATDCNECPPGKASDQTGNTKSNNCVECRPNT